MRPFSEVEFEWQTLKDLKARIPELSHFGGNNHDAIDCQLEVLAECMDTDAVEEKYETARRDDPWSENDNYVAAMNAAEWLKGEREESPSQNWRPAARA